MRDISTKFGKNAGKIWQNLYEKGNRHKKEIIKETSLDEKNFHAGIGWLARENKINEYTEDCYKLDNTNLHQELGSHAGRVYKILDIWGEVDYESVKRLSDLSDTELHEALGWLAREDKILTDKDNKFTLKK